MADATAIEWTDATWNPVTGCTLASEGCRHCYAAALAAGRLRHHPSRAGLARVNAAGEARFTGEVRFNEGWLDQPLRWTRPRRVFVCAHGDLFHPSVPDEWIDRVFAVMAQAQQHTFQVLTKRPERAHEYLGAHDVGLRWRAAIPEARRETIGQAVSWMCSGLPNVWLGTSVEDQATVDARIPDLLATPAAVRFVSAEPLLGPVDLALWLHEPPCEAGGGSGACTCVAVRAKTEPVVDWVIVGGESGRGARPMHPDWARSLRDQCRRAGVPFFFKQWGAWAPGENCDHVPTRSEHVAWWWDDEWSLDCLSPRASEAMHRDDAPDLYRIGKARAGRRLDGREWNEMPEGPAHD